MNLFNIQQEHLILAEQLSEGELTPELQQALVINESDLNEKGIAYGFVLKQKYYELAMAKQEKKNYAEMEAKIQKSIDRMETAIGGAMQLFQIDKIESPLIKLSFRKSESVEIINEAQLTEQFTTTKTTVTPNKVAIKTALKNGEVVEGAVLVTNLNLQIK
jgi:hypothetical protein